MIHFINIIMSEFYEIIFTTELPRVLDDMKKMLQLDPKSRTRDWFLYNENLLSGLIDSLKHLIPCQHF